jgi:hypothetical protein
MAAFRFFHLFRRDAVRSAYDETVLRAAERAPLTARWSVRSTERPACRWAA